MSESQRCLQQLPSEPTEAGFAWFPCVSACGHTCAIHTHIHTRLFFLGCVSERVSGVLSVRVWGAKGKELGARLCLAALVSCYVSGMVQQHRQGLESDLGRVWGLGQRLVVVGGLEVRFWWPGSGVGCRETGETPGTHRTLGENLQDFNFGTPCLQTGNDPREPQTLLKTPQKQLALPELPNTLNPFSPVGAWKIRAQSIEGSLPRSGVVSFQSRQSRSFSKNLDSQNPAQCLALPLDANSFKATPGPRLRHRSCKVVRKSPRFRNT